MDPSGTGSTVDPPGRSRDSSPQPRSSLGGISSALAEKKKKVGGWNSGKSHPSIGGSDLNTRWKDVPSPVVVGGGTPLGAGGPLPSFDLDRPISGEYLSDKTLARLVSARIVVQMLLQSSSDGGAGSSTKTVFVVDDFVRNFSLPEPVAADLVQRILDTLGAEQSLIWFTRPDFYLQGLRWTSTHELQSGAELA